MLQRIELQKGFSHGWLPLRVLLLAWGGIAILSSASPGSWTLVSLLSLLLVDRLVVRRMRRPHGPGGATLSADGILRLAQDGREQVATWTGRAWVCRWFCVVDWESQAGPRRGQTIVFSADNHPDDFRRLRVLLRLGKGEARS